MEIKGDSAGVVDAITAQDMGVFPDTNLAESLQRITGVSIDRSAFMLMLNLVLVAFGIGIAFQRRRLQGLLPVGVLLLYLTANSLARTSGARYVVPVDWILVAYDCVALAELVHATTAWLSGRAPVTAVHAVRKPSRTRRTPGLPASGTAQFAAHALTILAYVLVLGSLVPLAGVLYPRRYAPTDNAVLLQRLEDRMVQNDAGQDLSAFVQQPGAVIAKGRALYPLFYRRGEGEPTRYAPYTGRDYARTVFVKKSVFLLPFANFTLKISM